MIILQYFQHYFSITFPS